MSKPEKLTKRVLGDRPPDLPHAGNGDLPGITCEEFSVAVDRSADGRLALTFVHGGLNQTFVFEDDDRRRLGKALLEPHPDCDVCFAGGPPGGSMADCSDEAVTWLNDVSRRLNDELLDEYLARFGRNVFPAVVCVTSRGVEAIREGEMYGRPAPPPKEKIEREVGDARRQAVSNNTDRRARRSGSRSGFVPGIVDGDAPEKPE